MTSQPPRPKTKNRSASAAVTLCQLSALAGKHPTFFAINAADLPSPVPARLGASGRPQLVYALDQIAALILERTGHLSDAECRLRLALSGHRQTPARYAAAMQKIKGLGMFRLILDPNGGYLVVPYSPGNLADNDQQSAGAHHRPPRRSHRSAQPIPSEGNQS